MTREEAIKILKAIRVYECYPKSASEETKEAIDMAIEALSAEAKPTVIRSKTLLPTKDFKEWAKRIREVNPNAVVIPCDAEVVSADAVQGEWLQREIIDDDMECGVNDDATECSVCGYAFNSHYWAKTYFNYCPNCGARMEKGERNEML